MSGYKVLAAFLQVALDHHPDDPVLALGNLRSDIVNDIDLSPVLLAAIGMRGIDHDLRPLIRGV
jgi:hypothetical protein